MIALPPPSPLPEDIRLALQHQPSLLSTPGPKYLKPLGTRASSREYAASCARNRSTPPPERKGAQRSTMWSSMPTPPPYPLSHSAHPSLRQEQRAEHVFTFLTPPKPSMALTFLPRPAPPQPEKRARAITDIDGDQSCVFRKKRRLRLFLITSRLSPEFSHPASNIVDRGNSKIAVWAKQKALGRNLLRKAAILNSIRRRSLAAKETEDNLVRALTEQEKEKKQLELARLAFVYGSHDPHTRPVFRDLSPFPPKTAIIIGRYAEGRSLSKSKPISSTTVAQSSIPKADPEESSYRSPNDAYAPSYGYEPPPAQVPRKSPLPIAPSPLGLSNYDAFDLEDDIPDPYAHLDDDEDDPSHSPDDEYEFGCGASSSASTSRSLSISTTASYASTLSTAPTAASLSDTPPSHQAVYSDFNILDPEEPVLGDFDQIDEGAWPNSMALGPLTPNAASMPMAEQTSAIGPASCSPNFATLYAAGTPRDGACNTAPSMSQSPNFGYEARGHEERRRERWKKISFSAV